MAPKLFKLIQNGNNPGLFPIRFLYIRKRPDFVSFSGKFSLKNTVTAIFAGLGLLTFVTMVCDLILLNYTSEKLEVAERLKEF